MINHFNLFWGTKYIFAESVGTTRFEGIISYLEKISWGTSGGQNGGQEKSVKMHLTGTIYTFVPHVPQYICCFV